MLATSHPIRETFPNYGPHYEEEELSTQLIQERRASDHEQVRATVIRDGIQNTALNPRITLIISAFIFIPTIFVELFVVAIKVDVESCDRNLGLWLTLHAICNTFRLLLNFAIYRAHPQPIVDPNQLDMRVRRFFSLKQSLEIFSLAWFVIGQSWILGNHSCPESAPTLFRTTLAMLVITYCMLLAPCLVLIIVLPFACLCLPCLIRVLYRMQDPYIGRGASETDIKRLPVVKFETGMFSLDDAQCAICLSEYTEGEELRTINCEGNHHFHKSCVDQWLTLNGTCPCCRTSIKNDDIEQGNA